MKKITLLSLTILVTQFLTLTGQAQARDNGINGLLFGAGSGAIIGQAIGHNTGGTLIGTAVGSMFGYMLGNEMDKHGAVHYSPVQRRPAAVNRRLSSFTPRRSGVVVYRSIERRTVRRYPVFIPPSANEEPICRKTRMLATIDGEAEEVIGMSCLEDGQWRLQTNSVDIAQTVILRDHDDRHRRRMHHHGWRGWRR